jgi:hypothetical protein
MRFDLNTLEFLLLIDCVAQGRGQMTQLLRVQLFQVAWQLHGPVS